MSNFSQIADKLSQLTKRAFLPSQTIDLALAESQHGHLHAGLAQAAEITRGLKDAGLHSAVMASELLETALKAMSPETSAAARPELLDKAEELSQNLIDYSRGVARPLGDSLRIEQMPLDPEEVLAPLGNAALQIRKAISHFRFGDELGAVQSLSAGAAAVITLSSVLSTIKA